MQTVRTAWDVADYHRPVTQPRTVPSCPADRGHRPGHPHAGRRRRQRGHRRRPGPPSRRAGCPGGRPAGAVPLRVPPAGPRRRPGRHRRRGRSGREVADPRLDPLRVAAREAGVTALVGAAVRHPDGRRTIAGAGGGPDRRGAGRVRQAAAVGRRTGAVHRRRSGRHAARRRLAARAGHLLRRLFPGARPGRRPRRRARLPVPQRIPGRLRAPPGPLLRRACPGQHDVRGLRQRGRRRRPVAVQRRCGDLRPARGGCWPAARTTARRCWWRRWIPPCSRPPGRPTRCSPIGCRTRAAPRLSMPG